jgi:hypothetical protein
MSFNTSSHKISGLRSPPLASVMSFVAIACLKSSQSLVRRAMQTISNAMLKTRVLSGSNRSQLWNGVIGMAPLLVTGGSTTGLSVTDADNRHGHRDATMILLAAAGFGVMGFSQIVSPLAQLVEHPIL